MMRDEKLVSVAVKSRQPVERVIWVWGALLESASEINDGGRYEFDAAEAAYFLRADEADIVAVTTALEAAGRVADGRVVKWGARQYQSDKSAERQARYRERKRAQGSDGDGEKPLGDARKGVIKERGDGQVTSRDAVVTPPDTDTDTDTELPLLETKSPTTNVRAVDFSTRPAGSEKFEEFWAAYPTRGGASNPKTPAREKFARAVKSGADPDVLIASAKRYADIERKGGRFGSEKVAQAVTWLNQKRWNDYPPSASAGPGAEEDRWSSWLKSHARAIWSDHWGPEPGKPGCRIPEAFVARWRETHKQGATA